MGVKSPSEVVKQKLLVDYLKNGKWQDIDNSLVDSVDQDNNAVYENKDNAFKVKISKNSKTGKLVSIKMDGYEISWGFDGVIKNNTSATVAQTSGANSSPTQTENAQFQAAQENVQDINAAVKPFNEKAYNSLPDNDKKRTLTKLESGVNFNNIYSGTDIQYDIKSENVKESIIVKEKQDNPSYVFNIKADGLNAELLNNNSIVFSDKNDAAKKVFRIDAPYMFDAKNEISKDVKVTLEDNSNGYTLKLTPSKLY